MVGVLRCIKKTKIQIFFIRMEKIFIIAFLVVLVYVIIITLEMKYVDKEWKPLKEVVKTSIIVFISGVVAGFITFYSDTKVTDFLNIMTNTKVLDSATSQVFTGAPEF